MQIQFKQNELEEAVCDYLIKMGITGPVENISFTAGRGETGITTDVTIQGREVVVPMSKRASAPVDVQASDNAEEEEEEATDVVNNEAKPEGGAASDGKSLFG